MHLCRSAFIDNYIIKFALPLVISRDALRYTLKTDKKDFWISDHDCLLHEVFHPHRSMCFVVKYLPESPPRSCEPRGRTV